MKKLLCAFLFLSMLGVAAIPVSAQTTPGVIVSPPALEIDIPVHVYDVSASEIDAFALQVNDGTYAINPQTVEVLFDLSGNPSFLIADIIPHGFAIMFRNAAVISEQITSEGAVNPYSTARGRKIYAGPMTYIDFYNGIYTDILSGQELSSDVVRQMRVATANALNSLPEPSLFQAFFTPYTRFITRRHVVRDVGFGDNRRGTCGQIAAAIMLTYYERIERFDRGIMHRIVPEHLFPPTARRHDSLHNEMIRLTPEQFGGTMPSGVAAGLNSYFRGDGNRRALMASASGSIGNPSAVSNRAIREIRADRPVIIFTNPIHFLGGGAFGRHAMVAYGYSSNGIVTTHFIVHTGWWDGNSPRVDYHISVAWLTGVTWMTPIQEPRLDVGRGVSLNAFAGLPRAGQWTTGNPRVATVDSSGRVTAVGPGAVSITHVNPSNNERAVFDFNVFQPMRSLRLENVPVQNRRLSVNRNGLGGSSLQLRPVPVPHNSTALPLQWSSSDNAIATVNQNGLVTARGPGRAIISVTDSTGRRRARITFTVALNPERITLLNRGNPAQPNMDLAVNRGFRPRVNFTPNRAQGLCRNAERNITWTSSNRNAVVVDERGNIRAVAPGTSTITARTANGHTSSIVVRSVIPVASISIARLTPSQADAMFIDANGRGRSTPLFATVTPSNATNRNITWTSSNPNIVSVDIGGIITARSVGRATITATTPATGAQRARSARITINVRRR